MSDYVLLASAQPDVAVPVARLLESAGYRVHVAVSDPQALGLVAAAAPQLAIIDLDGRDADELHWLEEIKRRFGHLPFPVVLISERPDLAEEAQRLFADGWQPKPIDPAGLLSLVRNAAANAPAVTEG